MIEIIDSKHCKKDLVELSHKTSTNHLIVSSDNIFVLRENNIHPDPVYKGTINRVKNTLFDRDYNGYYYRSHEYNKLYLEFLSIDNELSSLKKLYIFKGTNRALCLKEFISTDTRNYQKKEIELTRKEAEEMFDIDNYDLMVVIDDNNKIFLANSKRNGFLGNYLNLIPSDRDIINLYLRNRHKFFCYTKEENDKKEDKEITIEDIKNFPLYTTWPFSDRFPHMLLTAKDGEFKLQWIKIEFVEKDKFKITTCEIPIVEPTVDDVLDYYNSQQNEQVKEEQKENTTINKGKPKILRRIFNKDKSK